MDSQNPSKPKPANKVDKEKVDQDKPVKNSPDEVIAHDEHKVHGKAVVAYGLMLLNLLFPVFMYFFLTLMWLKHRKSQDHLLYVAINQAWIAATLSTLVFIADNLIIVYFAQYKSTFALIVFETYYIFVVPIFLTPGLLGLVKSNFSQVYYFPLLGRRFKQLNNADDHKSANDSGVH